MRPDTASNLRSVKKNNLKNVVKHAFRKDSLGKAHSIKSVSNDI